MTFEATLMIETELPVSLTCDEATGILKGTSVKLANPATISAAVGDEEMCGGIIGSEKIASDGNTKAKVYRCGWFKVYASGAILAGQPVCNAGSGSFPNHFKLADASCSGSKTWGICMEDVADQESFLMELRPACNNNTYA